MPGREQPRPPALRVTRYEQISSLMIAVVFGLLIAVAALGLVLWVNRAPAPVAETIPLEILELPGGQEDGLPNETLHVESPEDASEDPSTAEEPAEETEIQEALDTVVAFSDQATLVVQEQAPTSDRNAGNLGSRKGTGGPALGSGKGVAGFPREQRWFIRFADDVSVSDYARQLDQFGIELGLLQDGKLYLVSRLSQAKPNLQTLDSGSSRSSWLYFTWQGGNRKKADTALFKKAGVNVREGTVFHFYPQQTEAELARLEFDYAKKPAQQIRRTYFVASPAGGSFQFVVTRQFYFR